jgi:hypothetical protein
VRVARRLSRPRRAIVRFSDMCARSAKAGR